LPIVAQQQEPLAVVIQPPHRIHILRKPKLAQRPLVTIFGLRKLAQHLKRLVESNIFHLTQSAAKAGTT
jgi:hypothetical protein